MSRSETPHDLDVVLITALKDELDAVRAVDDGAVDDVWDERRDSSGFRYYVRDYAASSAGGRIRIALAQAVEMGGLAAAQVAARLVNELRPRCLAMCGICAGRRGKVALGDVIVADRVYKYDDGKMIAHENDQGVRIEEVWSDIRTYNLDARWKQAAESFFDDWADGSESLVRQRPPSYRRQELWLLQGLWEQKGGDPPLSDHPDRKKKCPSWTDVVRRLRQRKRITRTGLKLTKTGRSFLEEQRTLHPDGLPEDEPFRLHVGPIATGSQVVEDGRVFERLARAERKVLGLEMEAAAIGMVAEVERVPWMIVAKGVTDHADREKDDSFRAFSARAAAEFVLAFLRRELPPREAPTQSKLAVRTSIDRLPVPGRFFVGRDQELRRLDQAWVDPHQHVISIVAWGGVGKSALVHRWLAALEREDYRGADCVYGWSFYSQGTEERLASADQFIDTALRWFGDPDPSAGSPRDRGLRLAELVRQRRTLLVLDGVEPLQHPPGPLAGRLKDPGLAALVKTLASSSSGLCVVTTRELIDDVGHLAESSAPRIDLEHLTPEAGGELLRHLGVKGTDRELRTAAEELGGHALTLTLLGTYLRKACGGEVRKRGEVALGEADERQGGHAYRVMAAYERWLGPGPELAILRLLGLFDRPAEGEAIAALRSAPVIPELNESLVGIAEKDWQWALSNLRDCGLLGASDPGAPATLDAHPLVRSYFGDELQARHPEAWSAGQERLYEHYRQAAPELPDTLAEMMPLYAAVVHGCRAGKQWEAFNEVYWPRISRRSEHYQLNKLGAFGADLVALSGFFAKPWAEPVAGFTDDDKAALLSTTGFELRALGRLAEAVQPMRAGLEMWKVQENWEDAAKSAGNLSELTLTLGDLSQAVASAEESVDLADRSGDAFLRTASRTTLADALHQAGRLEESATAFREAEAMQAEWQPQYPRLSSLGGYRYCDLLLGRSGGQVWSGLGGSSTASGKAERLREACRQLLERGKKALDLVLKGSRTLLDIALNHLTLGRAHFGLALSAPDSADFAPATEHLDRAVVGLRQAGTEHNLPWGLLARAALRRVRGDRTGASADLTEALEIAERGSMLLHQCDAHLGWTLLHLASGDAADARRHLALAKALVEKTGYHLRDAEVAFLEERLAAL